jgi:hypothetical protein
MQGSALASTKLQKTKQENVGVTTDIIPEGGSYDEEPRRWRNKQSYSAEWILPINTSNRRTTTWISRGGHKGGKRRSEVFDPKKEMRKNNHSQGKIWDPQILGPKRSTTHRANTTAEEGEILKVTKGQSC